MMFWPTSRGPETVRPTRLFGAARPGGRTHKGVDLGAAGDVALAAADGSVLDIRFDTPGPGSLVAKPGLALPTPGDVATGGLFVRVKHPDGTETRYMHLADAVVSPGEHVSAGQPIGHIGKSGFVAGSTTSAHLHFEVLRDGDHVDPLPLLAGQAPPHIARTLLGLGAVLVGAVAVICWGLA